MPFFLVICRSELDTFVNKGSLSKLVVAVSREEENVPKAYVQDEILRYAADVARFVVEQSAMVFVCG